MSETKALVRQSYEIELGSRLDGLKAIVPDEARRNRALRIACNSVLRSEGLAKAAKANPASFADAVVAIVEAGLEPGLQQAALVPYGDAVQPIIMFQGKVELALRSGLVSAIWADVIREGDEYSVARGESPRLTHSYGKDRGELLYAYAVAQMKDGSKTWVCLDKAEVDRHKASSKTASRSDSMWVKHPETAWRKTAMHELWKWIPKSFEMARAQEIDDDYDTEPTGRMFTAPQAPLFTQAQPAAAVPVTASDFDEVAK